MPPLVGRATRMHAVRPPVGVRGGYAGVVLGDAGLDGDPVG